ncbi:MAG: radical SAM protein, partial [Lachnospiraceae bacterium]|nr:radical SAM protein [Lachnospiraceae bacterium]
FPVRICFDPMIYVRNWREIYSSMIGKVAAGADLSKVKDISIGTFRISDQYLKNMRKKYPDSAVAQYPYVNEEGYYQYPDEVRLSMEEHIKRELSEKCPKVPVFDWK